jgi:hypothetical protein
MSVEEKKSTEAGHLFTRVSSEELRELGIRDVAGFGEAWRDPSGVIWGDIVRDESRKARLMNHKEAVAYCEAIGAVLPRRPDFVRLRGYFGTGSGNYKNQILPNMTFESNGEAKGFWFWGSTIHPAPPNFAYYFNGLSGVGYFDGRYREYVEELWVRCILLPKEQVG